MNFRENLKKLKDASDFQPYIDLLKTAKPLIDFLPLATQIDIHDAYFLFINRKEAFDNEALLIEVDKLHIELFESVAATNPFKYRSPSKETRLISNNITILTVSR